MCLYLPADGVQRIQLSASFSDPAYDEEDWSLLEGEADMSMDFYDDGTLDIKIPDRRIPTATSVPTASASQPTTAVQQQGTTSGQSVSVITDADDEARQKRIHKLKKVRQCSL